MSHFHHILKGILSQSSGVDADLAVYLASLTTPLSAGQITKLNTFVTSLKTGLGITTLAQAFDVMYIFGNETSESGLKNMVKRAHDAQTVNTFAFTDLEGFTGNGTNSYIRTNWTGSTQASAYELSSASFGIYFRATTDKAGFELHGVWDSSGTTRRIQIARPNGHSNIYVVGLNAGAQISASIERISGMYIGSRVQNFEQKLYVNKIEKISGTQASLAIPDQEVLISALKKNDGNPDFFENDQISLSFVGKGFSQSEVNIITDTFEAYMDSNGKGVIP